MELTYEYAHSRLIYDRDTGIFRWKPMAVDRGNFNAQFAGKIAGHIKPDGYVQFKLDGRLYSGHRLAWFMVHGEWPKNRIDHRNRVRHDNRIANLRPATVSEDTRNRGLSPSNTSGHTGVYWKRAIRKWIAQIKFGGRCYHLGCFDNIEDAIAARQTAAERYFGEFAPHIAG